MIFSSIPNAIASLSRSPELSKIIEECDRLRQGVVWKIIEEALGEARKYEHRTLRAVINSNQQTIEQAIQANGRLDVITEMDSVLDYIRTVCEDRIRKIEVDYVKKG